jgi:cyanocobalamin reductase (cyanide-eliminating) / alkylcobalamin dealkylase
MRDLGADVATAFASDCRERGVDLAVAFPVCAFNLTVDPDERLPDLGRADALAILVGNTRRMWPAFRAALAQNKAPLNTPHPLDDYVLDSVESAASKTGVRHEIRWAHAMLPRPMPIQRIAERAGLAVVSPSHLSVHREFGPWIALRAVVVFDVTGPEFSVEPPSEPCATCSAKPCLDALQRALEPGLPRSVTSIRIGADWRRWLAVRDACPTGTSYRYSDAQIEYHYTKSKSLLSDVKAPDT